MHNRKFLSSIPKEIATPIVNLTLTHVRSHLIAFQSNKPNRIDNTIIHLQPTSRIIAAILDVKKMPIGLQIQSSNMQALSGQVYPKRIERNISRFIFSVFMTHVAKIIEIVGSSDKSWQDAAQAALNEAKKTIHGIKGVEVGDMTAKVDPNNGNITEYHTAVKIAFGVEHG